MVSAESAYTNDRVAEAIRETLGIYVAVLENIIRYGQVKTKEFRTDLDAHIIAQTVFGSFMGAMLNQNLFRDSVAYDPTFQVLERLAADGLSTQR